MCVDYVIFGALIANNEWDTEVYDIFDLRIGFNYTIPTNQFEKKKNREGIYCYIRLNET